MQFSNNRNFTRGFIILASFLIVILIVWNTYYLFQVFKDEERNKVELWAMGTKALNDPELNDTGLDLALSVLTSNNTIPVFKTDKFDVILDSKNISPEILKDSVRLRNYFEDIKSKSKNTPFTGKKFKGKVLGVFNKYKHHFN